MKRSHRCILGAAFGLALIVLLVASFPGTGTAAQETKKPAKCCYTNPQYTGICHVTPGDGETCSTILSYLNNPNAGGKSYCGGSTVRGGWKQVPCKEKEGAATCRRIRINQYSSTRVPNEFEKTIHEFPNLASFEKRISGQSPFSAFLALPWSSFLRMRSRS